MPTGTLTGEVSASGGSLRAEAWSWEALWWAEEASTPGSLVIFTRVL